MTGGAASAGPVRQTRQRSSQAPAVHFAPASRGWSRTAPPVSQTTATDYLRPSRGWARTDHWGGSDASPELVRALRSGAAGRPLPADVGRKFGPPLGADFGNVRIHTDGTADRLARSIQAAAFTHDSDVYFSNGAYDPGTHRGQRLLAHELAHVAQHLDGPSSGTVIGRANDPAERAADRAADSVMGALHGGSALAVDPTRQADAPAPPANSGHTVRRKFGFEFELRIPVFSKGSRGGSAVPKPARPKSETDEHGRSIDSVQLAESDWFEVHVDHSKKLNAVVPRTAQGTESGDPMATILELATTPLNEASVDEAGVRAHLQKAADFATEAMRRSRRTDTANADWSTPLFDPDTLLDNLPHIKKATPPNTNYIGPAFEPAQINRVKVGVMSDHAYAQVTQGFSLKTLPRHFLDQAGDTSRIPANRKTALAEAVDIGTTATKWAMPRWRFPFGHGAARRELKGYFTAIAYYLRASALAGTEDFEGVLAKNMIGPFFFKTGLHTVGNQLRTKYPEVANLLATWPQRAALGDKLLELSQRGPAEKFFPNQADMFTCEQWLRPVLAGTADRALAGFKNPWSKELTAPSIGSGKKAGVGLVIENRRLAETLGVAGKSYAPDEWPDLAVRVFYQHLLLSGDDAQRRLAATKLQPAPTAPTSAPRRGRSATEGPGIPKAPPLTL